MDVDSEAVALLVPTRGRPTALGRLLEACAATCVGAIQVFVAVDTDDPTIGAYRPYIDGSQVPVNWVVGTRQPMGPWTNTLAQRVVHDFPYICSLGDDHVPRTVGWDARLVQAIKDKGGTGFSYGNDLAQGINLPTAVVMSSDIPRALNWVCLPGCAHYCVDAVWKDLGQRAGCLSYRDDVVIEHLHPSSQKANWDATYAEAGGFSIEHPDYAVYRTWVGGGQVDRDVTVIRNLIERDSDAAV